MLTVIPVTAAYIGYPVRAGQPPWLGIGGFFVTWYRLQKQQLPATPCKRWVSHFWERQVWDETKTSQSQAWTWNKVWKEWISGMLIFLWNRASLKSWKNTAIYFCVFMPHPVPAAYANLGIQYGMSPVSDIPNLQSSVHLLVSTAKWPVASCGCYCLIPDTKQKLQITACHHP